MKYFTNRSEEKCLLGKVDCSDETLNKLNAYTEKYAELNRDSAISFHMSGCGVFTGGGRVNEDVLDALLEEINLQMEGAVMEGVVKSYHGESQFGTKDGFEVTNGKAVTRLITEARDGSDVPYIYTDVNSRDRFLDGLPITKYAELAEGKALEQFSKSDTIPEEFRQWCSKSLEVANALISQMEQTGFKESVTAYVEAGDRAYEVSLTPFAYQGLKEAKSISDIDGYTTDDDVVTGGGYSIFKYATEIVNYAVLEQARDRFAEHVYDFYVEKVMPYEDIPYQALTEEEKDNFATFSDMHKDAYGFRPRSDESNMCKQIYRQNEALQTDSAKQKKRQEIDR